MLMAHDACRVTVIEAKELLGTFDGSLREYAARKLVAQGVKLRRVSGFGECWLHVGFVVVCLGVGGCCLLCWASSMAFGPISEVLCCPQAGGTRGSSCAQ
jgi:hypothetical protein